jgi:ABC-2 type transport system ATP-binding protein
VTSLAIDVRGLTRAFGSLTALDQVSIQVPRGIVFGLLGPNGSGKTTMIRILLGLLEPTAGTASVLGHDSRTNAGAIREACGALLEHSGLYERLSAADNLDLYGRFWRMSRNERRARTAELLTVLGLNDRRDEVVGGWSRGMKQQLAIARALFHRPQMVFLDEPTAGLDPTAAATLRDSLARLSASEGVTVFVTTHNLPEAERLCALVGVIRKGRMLAVAHPAHLMETAHGASVEITGSDLPDSLMATVRSMTTVLSARSDGRLLAVRLRSAGDVPQLISVLVAGGMEIESVRNTGNTLEGAFHALVEE